MTTPWDWLPPTPDDYAVVTADGYGLGAAATTPAPWWGRITRLDTDRDTDAVAVKRGQAHGAALVTASLAPTTWTWTVIPTATGTAVDLEEAIAALEAAWTPNPASPATSIWVAVPGSRFRLDGHYGSCVPTRTTPGLGWGAVTVQFHADDPARHPEVP